MLARLGGHGKWFGPFSKCSKVSLLLQSYSAMCVAAWSYIIAAACMGLTAGFFVDRKDWQLPEALLGPLLYWIFVCSVMGYYVVTFATQHLPASQASICKHTSWTARVVNEKLFVDRRRH